MSPPCVLTHSAVYPPHSPISPSIDLRSPLILHSLLGQRLEGGALHVVLVDNTLQFGVLRLAELMRAEVHRRDQAERLRPCDVDRCVHESLARLRVFSCSSAVEYAATLCVVEQLTLSANPPALLLVDAPDAFYWARRLSTVRPPSAAAAVSRLLSTRQLAIVLARTALNPLSPPPPPLWSALLHYRLVLHRSSEPSSEQTTASLYALRAPAHPLLAHPLTLHITHSGIH
jgi:hypothetical protein